MDSALTCVEMEPPGETRTAVIWLHGLGADGHDFEPVVPFLRQGAAADTRFVFPNAPRRPVTINGGMIMPAWYDIRTLTLRRDIDEGGVRESAEQVRALVARENARGVPCGRIVLAGFSQGGAVALYAALRYPERLAGIVALSTYMVCDEDLERERSEANRETPIFQAHGTLDPMVPLEAGRAGRDRLQGLGYGVVWHEYRMGHEVCPEEITDLAAALERMFAEA